VTGPVRSLEFVGRLALIALAILLAAVTLVPSRGLSDRDAGWQLAGSTGPRFYIRGHARNLFPGGRKTLLVAIRNPNRFPINIDSLSLAVRDSDRSGCGRLWIRPRGTFDLALLVPRDSRAFAGLPIRLRRGAPQACQGARWPLKFSGTAVKR